MKLNEFKARIKDTYNGKFDKSLCSFHYHKHPGNYISINCYLGRDISEVPYRIADNDMISALFLISLPKVWNENDDLPENMELRSPYHCIKILPEDKRLHCDHKRLSFRKTTGSAEKLIAAFEKFTGKLYMAIEAEYQSENLLPFDMELIRNKGYYPSSQEDRKK